MLSPAPSLQTAFPPIAHPDARILILGSMPSVASLHAQQYYAHPRNAFWWIMGELCGADGEQHYTARAAMLRRRGIAVWDVIRACRREGSLDQAIDEASLLTNDFAAFFARHRRIKAVFFNGNSVARLFRIHVLGGGDIAGLPDERHTLPSTSPANARLTWAEKLEKWRALSPFLTAD